MKIIVDGIERTVHDGPHCNIITNPMVGPCEYLEKKRKPHCSLFNKDLERGIEGNPVKCDECMEYWRK